jgi:hypothetical protein
MMAKVNIVHIPYKGGAPRALTALLSGEVGLSFENGLIVTAAHQVGEGARHCGHWCPALEAGARAAHDRRGRTAGLQRKAVWYGLVAPRPTPREIVNRLKRRSRANPAHCPKSSNGCRARARSRLAIARSSSPHSSAPKSENGAKLVKTANMKAD